MLAFFFSPSGRIGRAQWWLAQLAVIIIIFIAASFMVTLLSATGQARMTAAVPLSVIFVPVMVMLIWIGFCLTVKRYHDRGKSAWWYLIQFIPFIGGIWALIELGFCAGDGGENEYGDGPDLNIGEDLKALRNRSGQQSSAAMTSTYRPSAAPRTSGPQVFGKRA